MCSGKLPGLSGLNAVFSNKEDYESVSPTGLAGGEASGHQGSLWSWLKPTHALCFLVKQGLLVLLWWWSALSTYLSASTCWAMQLLGHLFSPPCQIGLGGPCFKLGGGAMTQLFCIRGVTPGSGHHRSPLRAWIRQTCACHVCGQIAPSTWFCSWP